MAQLVKNLPAKREIWVQSLGWEDPLEKGKTLHSSILAREFQGLYSPWGLKESDTTERLSLFFKKKNMLMLVQLVRKTFFRTIVINVKTIEILGSSPNTASE